MLASRAWARITPTNPSVAAGRVGPHKAANELALRNDREDPQALR